MTRKVADQDIHITLVSIGLLVKPKIYVVMIVLINLHINVVYAPNAHYIAQILKKIFAPLRVNHPMCVMDARNWINAL
jgi:hypothetical protein